MIALLAGLALAAPGAAGADPAAFGDHLLAAGDPFNALTWYRLALFQRPDRPDAGALRFRMALCWERGGQWDQAEAAWLVLADEAPSLAGPALYRAAAVQLAADRPAVARMHLADLRLTDPGWTERADLLEAVSWLDQGDLDRGAEALAGFARRHPGSRWAAAASRGAEVAGAPIGRRSPGLAAALSLVVPGAGQVYAGNPGDGLMAFLTSGVLGAWSATLVAWGVEEERSWAIASGATLGGVAAFTWASNVLGAARGARRVNAHRARRQGDEALRTIADPALELHPDEVRLPDLGDRSGTP